MANKNKTIAEGRNCVTSSKYVDRKVELQALREMDTGGGPLLPSFDDVIARESYQPAGSMDDFDIDPVTGAVIELGTNDDD